MEYNIFQMGFGVIMFISHPKHQDKFLQNFGKAPRDYKESQPKWEQPSNLTSTPHWIFASFPRNTVFVFFNAFSTPMLSIVSHSRQRHYDRPLNLHYATVRAVFFNLGEWSASRLSRSTRQNRFPLYTLSYNRSSVFMGKRGRNKFSFCKSICMSKQLTDWLTE
jgi:hypothetical protein